MIEGIIIPGAKVELVPISRVAPKPDEERKSYLSKVVDVLSDDEIEITMPMEQTKLILLQTNGEYQIIFYTDHGLYQCKCVVLSRYKEGNMFLAKVELLSDLKKFQRREYYRYSCTLPIGCRMLSPEEQASLKKGNLILQEGLHGPKGITADISGGGVRFVSNQEYPVGEFVVCSFTIPVKGEDTDFELVGKLLSCTPMENRKESNVIRIQFMYISNDQREQIIHFIFEQERQNRKQQSGNA